jgi:hypothetical protein
MNQEQRENVCNRAQRLRRGSAGAAFGNPAHLLDAANYFIQAWNAITPITISRVFKKAAINTLLTTFILNTTLRVYQIKKSMLEIPLQASELFESSTLWLNLVILGFF